MSSLYQVQLHDQLMGPRERPPLGVMCFGPLRCLGGQKPPVQFAKCTHERHKLVERLVWMPNIGVRRCASRTIPSVVDLTNLGPKERRAEKRHAGETWHMSCTIAARKADGCSGGTAGERRGTMGTRVFSFAGNRCPSRRQSMQRRWDWDRKGSRDMG